MKAGIGMSLLVLSVTIIIILVVAVSAQVWDQPQGKQAFGHTHDYTTLVNFPGACPAGQFATGIDATLTCATPAAGADDDWLFSGNNIYRTSGTVAIGSFPAGAALLSKLYVINGPGNNAAQRIEHTSTAMGLFINPISGGIGPSLWANGRGRFDALVVGSVAGDNVAFNPGPGNLIVASNVGIGTPSPSAKLEVAGKIKLSGTTLTEVFADDVLDLRAAGSFPADSSRIELLSAPVFEPAIAFFTGNAPRMRITPNGNVGIGTETPQSKLQVNGYIQLALTSGAPPSTDCDSASELGRMKVDNSGGGFLYVCTTTVAGIGWIAK